MKLEGHFGDLRVMVVEQACVDAQLGAAALAKLLEQVLNVGGKHGAGRDDASRPA